MPWLDLYISSAAVLREASIVVVNILAFARIVSEKLCGRAVQVQSAAGSRQRGVQMAWLCTQSGKEGFVCLV